MASSEPGPCAASRPAEASICTPTRGWGIASGPDRELALCQGQIRLGVTPAVCGRPPAGTTKKAPQWQLPA